MNILGTTIDRRTDTNVIYAQLPISEYLALVGENFYEFPIQRRREKYKAYQRMKDDVTNGALLPTITLAVRIEHVEEGLSILANGENAELADFLIIPGRVHILDGLQRTHILKDLQKDGVQFKEGQTLMIEFWLEQNVRNLIYRIIVLNAGQKPMSMRHQVEVLFTTVKDKLEKEIPGLEIFTEREANRRTKPAKFALDRVAMAYQCFVTKTPEVERQNLVAQKLVEEDVLSSSEEVLGEQFDSFVYFLRLYAELDRQICRVYQEETDLRPAGILWFGSENVMNSFFAAVSDFGSNEQRKQRVTVACKVLLHLLKDSLPDTDPLHLSTWQQVTKGFNTRKVNVGFATRKLTTSGFKEYFREEGETSFENCWLNAAE